MPNLLNEILEHEFKIGENSHEFQLEIDLRLVRKYSKIAEFEAQQRETIILDDQNVFFQPIDQDNYLLKEDFALSLEINNHIELLNFKNQIKKLGKRNIDLQHYEHLIYLAKQSKIYERQLFENHKVKFSKIKLDIDFLIKLADLLSFDSVDFIKMEFFKNKVISQGKISLEGHLAADTIKILVRHYQAQTLNSYLPIINDVLSTEFNEGNIRFADLKDLNSKLDDYIKANSEASGKRYLRNTLLVYIRDNIPNIKKGVNYFPNSDEARLIFFILCITGNRTIFPANKSLVDPFSGEVDQNDRVIKSIVEPFKDPPLPIESLAPQDSKIFELYLPLISI
jgi:hypothetical protein